MIREEELRKMGVGWFILKYADENGMLPSGVSIKYGSDKAMKARNYYYEQTRAEHNVMIAEIRNSGLSKSVRAGVPEMNYADIEKILRKL